MQLVELHIRPFKGVEDKCCIKLPNLCPNQIEKELSERLVAIDFRRRIKSFEEN